MHADAERSPRSPELQPRASRPKRRLARIASRLLVVIAALAAAAPRADAQYFGRNKVQFERLDFRVLPSEHFELYFYPAESLATSDAARMAERWYHRHSAILGQTFQRNPLIFYADQPDFQQSNVIEEFIGQGTGGVTEGMRDRVIMPFTGVYAQNDHVLGHELVHVFQYRVAQATRGSVSGMERLPLWFVEGMAEYLSVGRNDPNTAMWLRDALRRDKLPTIRQLETDPKFFPYRYGQALWAYIGGTWGDETVGRLFQAALQSGTKRAISSVLHVSEDSLGKAWHAAIRKEYGSLGDRDAPDRAGRGLAVAPRAGDQNVSPSVSPDGRYVAFFSSRSLFGFDVYVADAATGRIVKRLTSVTSDRHFDELSFISTAGTWSPDGRKFAFAVYSEGNNEIDIVDIESGRTEQRIRPAGIGAMSDPAWSPDGRRIAFSGLVGGISDLYVHDLAAGTTERLTSGREAELQPSWSPDGRTIAFVTDRSDATDFGDLRYAPMQLALIDVASREVRVLPRFGAGKAINPQFSGDGTALFFISDQDGVSDIYRRSLSNGETARVTRLATGVSGITALSPALSVARSSGEIVFSVFDRAGFSIRSLASAGAAFASVTPAVTADAALLPPGAAVASSTIERAIAEPRSGLPSVGAATTRPYRSALAVNSVQAANVGVTFGGGYGTWVGGGVAVGFTDMVGNRLAQAVLQTPGQVKDIAGELFYLDRSRRWNWGAEAYHVPVVGAYASYQDATLNVQGQPVAGSVVTQTIQRVIFDDAHLLAQYPLSSTRRFEFRGGFQRVSFSAEVDSMFFAGTTYLGGHVTNMPMAPALNFATAAAAYVGDYAFFGFTSPVAGGRYRFEIAPYAGSLNYETALADYRHYFFARPVTVAVRGIFLGRLGPDGESPRLQPMYIGQPSLVRGYDATDFSIRDCTNRPGSGDPCPEYSRLNGSRIAVANAEIRIPLLGTEQFGLINFPYVPTEIAPFIDAGLAWNRSGSFSLRFDQDTPERVPVVSSGVSARFNVLGALVLEIFWAHPYQRPGRGSFVGWQLSPGW